MHHPQRPFESNSGVVDKAENRTKFLAQVADQVGYRADLAEVERHEMDRALSFVLGMGHGRSQILVFLPRYRDRAITGGCKFLRDAEAEAAAAAGHEHAARRFGFWRRH